MIAGIVARGPQHILLPDRRTELDVLIGVNHAVASYHCDWWSFGDAETYLAGVRPVCEAAHPTLWFTNQNAANRLRKRGYPLPDHAQIWETFPRETPRCNWTVFSAVAALVLARRLGADRIVCFGVVDPEPLPGEVQRWATERRIWNETTAWLSTLGVTVERA